MEIVVEPVNRIEYSEDPVYFAFITEYSKYISPEVDEIFVCLINNIIDYIEYQGNYINLIKDSLPKANISDLDINFKEEMINFNGTPEENLRLSILLPKIIKLRALIYKKAYYLASDIVLGRLPDNKLQEDIILANMVLKDLTLENFYADLVTYNTEESIERFYSECKLIDLIIKALDGEALSIEQVSSLEHDLYKMHKDIFGYLKMRYIKRNSVLEKSL